MMRSSLKKPLKLTKQISIIGCGWLGFPLAKYLLKDGYRIKGSTTSIDKIEALKSVGIDSFYVETIPGGIKGEIENCLFGSEILILNIPPGLRKTPEMDFVKQMAFLIPFIEKSSIQKVLFISSTSVFADEKSIPIITENSVPNPDSESGKQLLEVETLFKSNTHFKTTILRFSGLFGEDRHPAKYLSGRTNLNYPDAPVNLIHREDCIGIIRAIIEQNCWDETFNASTEPHPSRKDYYSSICKAMNLPLPHFNNAGSNKGKRIDSQKLLVRLGYVFKVTLNN